MAVDSPIEVMPHVRDQAHQNLARVSSALQIAARTLNDVIAAVQQAQRRGNGLRPLSSTGDGRGQAWATANGQTILDLSLMKSMLHVDARDRIAHIEAGITFDEFDQLLKPHGMRSFRPLLPRSGKSVIASYLDRQPILNPGDHWDVGDPFGGTMLVLGNGKLMPTGGAAIEGSFKKQIEHGHRHLLSAGPMNLDPLRVLQGSQGTLGVMPWAAVYCQPIPAIERSWFASADTPAPILELAKVLLHRRLADVLFIADRVQLASLLAGNKRDYNALKEQLPAWSLFVSLAAGRRAPEQKMAWQSADLSCYAQDAGVALTTQLAELSAEGLLKRLRKPDGFDFRTVANGGSAELFFLSQIDRAADFTPIVADVLARAGFGHLDLATYCQPMSQGVSAHIGFTIAHNPDLPAERASLANAIADAARACAAAGAFFSRPYEPWLDLSFEQGATTAFLRDMAKTLFDPENVMNPGRFPYRKIVA